MASVACRPAVTQHGQKSRLAGQADWGDMEILETLDLGSSLVILRRAEASDLPAIIGLLAADQLGATRDAALLCS
jgi:hypothetical protein